MDTFCILGQVRFVSFLVVGYEHGKRFRHPIYTYHYFISQRVTWNLANLWLNNLAQLSSIIYGITLSTHHTFLFSAASPSTKKIWLKAMTIWFDLLTSCDTPDGQASKKQREAWVLVVTRLALTTFFSSTHSKTPPLFATTLVPFTILLRSLLLLSFSFVSGVTAK